MINYNKEKVYEALPEELRSLIQADAWEKDTIGESDTAVYRVTLVSGNTAYLKIASPSSNARLYPEKDIYLWLKGRISAPDEFF